MGRSRAKRAGRAGSHIQEGVLQVVFVLGRCPSGARRTTFEGSVSALRTHLSFRLSPSLSVSCAHALRAWWEHLNARCLSPHPSCMSAADLDDLLLPTTTPPSSTTPHARLAAAEDQTALALGVLVLVLLVSSAEFM